MIFLIILQIIHKRLRLQYFILCFPSELRWFTLSILFLNPDFTVFFCDRFVSYLVFGHHFSEWLIFPGVLWASSLNNWVSGFIQVILRYICILDNLSCIHIFVKSLWLRYIWISCKLRVRTIQTGDILESWVRCRL